MEEGSNAELDLNNSEETNEIPEEESNVSDSNEGGNDNRNIIELGPEENNEGIVEEEGVAEGGEEVYGSEEVVDEAPESEEPYKDERDWVELVKRNEVLIKELETKVVSLSEDVDDLISLYEIVSVEMNPFVGLSKITRSRLDALANIDKEFGSLKQRLEELEASIASGASHQKNDDFSEDFYLTINVDDIVEEALDYIFEKSRIDGIIDEFIEDLKIGNVAI